MQSQASSGLSLMAPAPIELQPDPRTEAQPGQSEPNAQSGEEMDPQTDMCKLPMHPHTAPQSPLQCLECHIIFSDPERQERHLKRSHPAEYEQYILRNAFFTCYICGLQFTNSGELIAHQETHTEKKPYKCMICGQAFNKAFQLTLHKKIHIGEEGFQCTDCGKACKTMTLLKYHRRTHTGERPFICKECGRRFAMSKYLKKHMLFHSKRGAKGDGRHISDDGGSLKGTNTLLNHVKTNYASLPAEASDTPPAGHRTKQSLPVISQSVSKPELPQLGANGHLLYVDNNMDTEKIRWHPESLENMQKVNHIIIMGQVPVGGQEAANVDGGPKYISCSVCNTTFKTTTALLSHIKTRHASLLSAASKASAAGHQMNLPITQDVLLRLLASGPKDKYDANMDEEQIFRLTEFLKGIQREVSQRTEVTNETTEQTVTCSIHQEESDTTDVIKVIIEEEIKDEQKCIKDKSLSSTPISSADKELYPKTVINKSQGLSASFQPQHHCDVQAQEECSVGPNEARATQDRSICWNGEPAVKSSSPSKQGSLACTDCGLMFTNQEVFKTHLHQHALEDEEEEDEEEAEKGEDRSHAAHLGFTEMYDESMDHDMGGDENLSTMSSSLQSHPLKITQDRGVRQNNSCSVCGKVYKYLNSLIRHEQQHNKSDSANKCAQKVGKYECPDCGMAFIRKARLIGHMRTHWLSGPLNLESLNCDQCNKTFTSEKSWQSHIALHKRKPFWCPSCSKGFFNEESLTKHLQSHNPSVYTCDICDKSFSLHSQLMHHQNTHTGARPFQCTVCGQAFANPKKLILHKKLHVRVSSEGPLGLKESVAIVKKLGIVKQEQTFTSVFELKDTNVSEMTDKGCWMEESRTPKSYQDAEFVDCEYTVEEDWEPFQPCDTSEPPGVTASDAHHESTLETLQLLNKVETRDKITYEEHKYWEWECCVCEMGFDEVAELHMHYIKHATGEQPIHDDLKG